MTPTEALYKPLDNAYAFFNSHLFNGELPEVIFTFQRKNQCMGYFAPDRWATKDGKTKHEISVNPAYITESILLEVFQTLVHEMCHCWQQCFGKVSRGGYHNKQWANKMESIGLIPSSTGKPEGKKTGQNMNDYPEIQGQFVRVCNDLVKHSTFKMTWFYRYPVSVDNNVQDGLIDTGSILAEKVSDLMPGISVVLLEQEYSIKVKYSCLICNINVWGKSGLIIKCGVCDSLFICNVT